MFGALLREHCLTLREGEVLGFPGTCREAMVGIAQGAPECLVMSPALGGEDAFQLVAPARERCPDLRVVVIAATVDEFTLIAMERLHLETLVDCAVESFDVVEAVLRTAHSGQGPVTRRYLAARHAWRNDARAVAKRLSDRQREILSLIGLGLENAEIGARLRLDQGTVKWHRSEILRRLDVASTAKLIHFAAERGFCRGFGAA